MHKILKPILYVFCIFSTKQKAELFNIFWQIFLVYFFLNIHAISLCLLPGQFFLLKNIKWLHVAYNAHQLFIKDAHMSHSMKRAWSVAGMWILSRELCSPVQEVLTLTVSPTNVSSSNTEHRHRAQTQKPQGWQFKSLFKSVCNVQITQTPSVCV